MAFNLSKRLALFIPTFLLLFCFQDGFAISVDAQLRQLSLHEKEYLKHFFASAIKKDHLGHVLFFSNKPACLSGGFILGKRSLDKKLFFKGWEILKKNEHLFPHPNFIIYDEIVDFGNDDLALHIYIINKKTLLHCLSQNEKIINEALGNKFSKEKFIRALETRNIRPLIEEDQALVGILLGYGNESSLDFKKYIGTVCVKRSEQDPDERKKHLKRIKGISCSRNETLTVHPITFMGDPSSEEVQRLKELYSDELEKICDLFNKRDLLKISLEAFCNA